MTTDAVLRLDQSMRAALDELEAAIRGRYPESRFRISRGEDDPVIVQLVAIVDVEDSDPVLDVVMDRILELQAEGLPIFVVTERPRERTLAMREAERGRGRVPVSAALPE